MSEDRYWGLEIPGWDNEIEVTRTDEGVTVAVTQEHAVDSYNSTFTCSFKLSDDEARDLAQFLLGSASA